MKIIIAIELGNEAMRTSSDVVDAVERAFQGLDPHVPLEEGDSIWVKDLNGNTVGDWIVVDS